VSPMSWLLCHALFSLPARSRKTLRVIVAGDRAIHRDSRKKASSALAGRNDRTRLGERFGFEYSDGTRRLLHELS
jgi:hypothetical protein